MLDANEARASTSLRLSHLHTPDGSQTYSKYHPLYPGTPWIGSPLVKLTDEDLSPESAG